MRNNQTFEKFNSKLVLEAILNAVLMSLSVGFSAGGVVSLVSWLCGYKEGIWITLGVSLGLALIAFPFFYIFKFRPNAMGTGRRVDALGLKERSVTMLENLHDQSYMAMRQRLDAVSHIIATSTKSLKTAMPAWVMISFSASFGFGLPFGVVETLYAHGNIESPTAIVDTVDSFIEVSYLVDEGGEIYGDELQLLYAGEDATGVTAVALDGYAFLGWSDGNTNPSRIDLNVTEDIEVIAMFEQLPDDGLEMDGDAPGEAVGDDATDQPSEGDGSGAQGNEGDADQGDAGDGEDGKGDGDQQKGENPGDGKGEGAGGKFAEGNQIINGEMYYRDWLEQYKDEAMDEILSLDDLPPELREFIEAYYEGV